MRFKTFKINFPNTVYTAVSLWLSIFCLLAGCHEDGCVQWFALFRVMYACLSISDLQKSGFRLWILFTKGTVIWYISRKNILINMVSYEYFCVRLICRLKNLVITYLKLHYERKCEHLGQNWIIAILDQTVWGFYVVFYSGGGWDACIGIRRRKCWSITMQQWSVYKSVWTVCSECENAAETDPAMEWGDDFGFCFDALHALTSKSY